MMFCVINVVYLKSELTDVSAETTSLMQTHPVQVEEGHVQMQEVGLAVMDEVSALVEQKSELLNELKDMNTRAAAGEARDPSGVYADAFQTDYASKIIEVRDAYL